MMFIFLTALLSYAVAACPFGASEWQGNCYYLSSNRLAWTEAEAFCMGGNGHLTSVINAVESNFLGDFLAAADSAGFDDVWSAGNNLADGVTWQWSDGAGFSFTKWKAGFPMDISENQCVAVDRTNGFFTNENCHQPKRFLCKFATNAITTPAPGRCNCPFGYEIYQGFCYKVFFGLTTWYDANATCVQEGGNLASIHTIQENRYIAGLALAQPAEYPNRCDIGNRMWIGYWDPKQELNYTWTDGTGNTFLSWSSGEPNSVSCGTGVHCASMLYDSGAWTTLPCAMSQAYAVCKLAA